jgi:hypothetical protein
VVSNGVPDKSIGSVLISKFNSGKSGSGFDFAVAPSKYSTSWPVKPLTFVKLFFVLLSVKDICKCSDSC